MTDKETGHTIAHAIKLKRADFDALRKSGWQEKTKTTIQPTVEGVWVKTMEIVEVFHAVTPGFPDLLFDVRAIKDAILDGVLAFGAYEATVDREWFEHVEKNGGVEEERMAQLTGKDLKRILIAVKWPQGWTQIIDGNNRFVKRYRVGLRTVRFVVVPLMNCLLGGFACEPGKQADMLKLRRANAGYDFKEVVYTPLDTNSPEVKKFFEDR